MAEDKSRKRINLSRLEEWQGRPTIKQNNQITFHWDANEERYVPVSSNPNAPDKDQRIVGIYYTYFQAIGAYGIPGRTTRDYFYSTDIFGRAIFRSNDGMMKQGIRPSDYGGLLSFNFLSDALNEALNTTDWRTAYREIEYSYEQGTAVYYYTRSGKRRLRKFPIPKSRITERNFSKKRADEIDRTRKLSRRKQSQRR